jgi:two-component system chemotaxis response regulator CheV
MELLIFRLGKTPFGINVAKVREIIQRPKTFAATHASHSVEGSFNLRGEVLTLLNLGEHFTMECGYTKEEGGLVVIVEMNHIRCGILVDVVEVISRLSWKEIEPPSKYLTHQNVPITATAKVDNETVLIVDFESVIAEILGIGKQDQETDEGRPVAPEKEVRIVMADDSAMIRKNLERVLQSVGYTKLTICCDGQEAWEHLAARREDPDGPCDLVLTDIEMPRMDGLHLTARIRNDSDFRNIPVVLFSSLITEENRKKGDSVGADAQISKPDSTVLAGTIEKCIARRATMAEEEDRPAPAAAPAEQSPAGQPPDEPVFTA